MNLNIPSATIQVLVKMPKEHHTRASSNSKIATPVSNSLIQEAIRTKETLEGDPTLWKTKKQVIVPLVRKLVQEATTDSFTAANDLCETIKKIVALPEEVAVLHGIAMIALGGIKNRSKIDKDIIPPHLQGRKYSTDQIVLYKLIEIGVARTSGKTISLWNRHTMLAPVEKQKKKHPTWAHFIDTMFLEKYLNRRLAPYVRNKKAPSNSSSSASFTPVRKTQSKHLAQPPITKLEFSASFNIPPVTHLPVLPSIQLPPFSSLDAPILPSLTNSLHLPQTISMNTYLQSLNTEEHIAIEGLISLNS